MLSDNSRGSRPAFAPASRSVRIERVRNRTFRTWFAVLAVLATALAALASGERSPEPTEFVILSYNTHGLAGWIAGDDPEERFPRIGALANRYHVALIQEDFAHHSALRRSSTHGIVVRGNGPRFSWLERLRVLCGRCGSGLTLLAKDPFERATRLLREPFSSCSGWLGSGNDCWATKGLLMARMELSSGEAVDFFNLHLDAGDGVADRDARRRQLDRAALAVRRESRGHAVIVGGDFNLRYDHAEDRALLDRFRSALQLTDTGAGLSQPRKWPEKIDYLLYRSGDDAEVELLEAGIATEFGDGEGALSDHPAIYARFRAQPVVKGGGDVPE
jgi:hypothetical protein